MDNNSFKNYLKGWSVSPNLSNQNFHNKLIHALALSYDVDVICNRSINKHFKHKKLPAEIVKEGDIYWKYLYTTRNKIAKFFHLWKRIKKITLFDQNIIVVDTLNMSLLKKAIKIKLKKHIKIIGVCTDNPKNISFTSKHYQNKLLALGRLLDGYIVLTEKINELYNKRNKPFIKIDGVSDTISDNNERIVEGDYIYFGGSLMKEYGVYNLIEAFKKLNREDIKLILCGHHVNKDSLNNATKDNKNIEYLGPVDYAANLSLERNALLTVNPRPQNERIDLYSFPSKTLEFLANECLTVAVDNPLLKEHYEDCIIWSKSGDENDLYVALEKALSLSKQEKEKYIKLGKEKVMQYTSPSKINELLTKLISENFFN